MDGEGVFHPNRFAFLLAGCPLGHGGYYPEGFFVERGIHALGHYGVADAPVFLHAELHENPALYSVFHSYCGILHITGEVGHASRQPSRKLRHLFHYVIDVLVFLCLRGLLFRTGDFRIRNGVLHDVLDFW